MIIAFAGKKQSGKTSSCDFTGTVFSETLGLNYYTYNFADPLKQMCIDIFGLTYDQCYGSDENKNELVNCYWPDTPNPMTAREVMQYVGTDIFRKMQTNVWADSTIRKIESNKYPLSLIADCRFPNEVSAVKNAGGIVIKLNRNLYNSCHASETALDEDKYDQSNFDLIIENHTMSLVEKNAIILDFIKSQGILT